MCVCVFWIYVLKIVVERWFWEVNMVFESLVELHAWLHSCLCFSLLEKLFLKASLTPSRYLAICRASKFFLIVISTPGGSIEKVSVPLIASRHLVNRSSLISYVSCFCTSTLSWHLYLSTAKSSTPGLTPCSTPFDTFIFRALLRLYIFFLVWSEPYFSRSLSR